jgi:hypothetical protein
MVSITLFIGLILNLGVAFRVDASGEADSGPSVITFYTSLACGGAVEVMRVAAEFEAPSCPLRIALLRWG